MAKKRDIQLSNGQTVAGYDANGVLGLYLHQETNLWRACHLKTGRDICGPEGMFKRKRSCLIFIENLAHLNWDAADEESMYSSNGGFEALVSVYKNAVDRALEVE